MTERNDMKDMLETPNNTNNTNKALIERKDYVSELDGKTHYFCKITLPEEITEGCRKIKFSKPLVLEVYHIGEETGYKVAYYNYDFGMNGQTALDSEHNCILLRHDDLSDEEKIVYDVTFDLMHAFFHCSEDPNYTYLHWALYGNLKDRVVCREEE